MWRWWDSKDRPKPPRLKVLAERIMVLFPDLEAFLEEGYCDTDRPCGNLRIPGAGRTGNELVVRHRETGVVVYRHNSAETYRKNTDVINWIGDEAERRAYGFPPAKWEQGEAQSGRRG